MKAQLFAKYITTRRPDAFQVFYGPVKEAVFGVQDLFSDQKG
jgi:hypothetical protein